MNLLDRYIFKSVLGSCLAAVALFAFVLMLGNAIRDLLGYVLAGQLPLLTFGELLLLLLPFVASYALPMGILTGVLLTLGRLSADSEVTAMRAAGISLTRLARPVLITTGRQLRERGWPDEVDSVVVMLDGGCAFQGLAAEGMSIWWGAYLAMPQQVLIRGPLATAGPEIMARRAELRQAHGWIMDTYLLRRERAAISRDAPTS